MTLRVIPLRSVPSNVSKQPLYTAEADNWPQLCKVQMPLAGAGAALIYNKDRSFMTQVPLEPDIVEWMGDEVKKFGELSIDRKTGVLSFGKQLPDPGW